MKKWLGVILLAVFFTGCGGSKTEIEEVKEETPKVEAKTEDAAIPEMEVGKEFLVKTDRGDYKFKINTLEKTDYRNQFIDQNPKQVVKLNYTYENIDFMTDGKSHLQLLPEAFKLLDDEGNVLRIYEHVMEPLVVAAGEKSTLELYYSVETDSKNIKLKFSRADKADAEMVVNIE